MANDTTAMSSVQPMTAESAANAIEAMMSGDSGEQQNLEAQQDETEDEYVEEESEQSDEESDETEESSSSLLLSLTSIEASEHLASFFAILLNSFFFMY